MGKLSTDEINDANLTHWRPVDGALRVRYLTKDFTTGAKLVAAIAEAADAVDHHPDILLTYPQVDITLVSHDVQAITDRDVALARTISQIATGLQIEGEAAG